MADKNKLDYEVYKKIRNRLQEDMKTIDPHTALRRAAYQVIRELPGAHAWTIQNKVDAMLGRPKKKHHTYIDDEANDPHFDWKAPYGIIFDTNGEDAFYKIVLQWLKDEGHIEHVVKYKYVYRNKKIAVDGYWKVAE